MGKMVDMEMSDAERKEECAVAPTSSMTKYPWGLCLNLGHEELKKLGLDADCGIGDSLEFCAMAKVTNISKNETTDGERCSVSLQITHMDVEGEEEPHKAKNPYDKK